MRQTITWLAVGALALSSGCAGEKQDDAPDQAAADAPATPASAPSIAPDDNLQRLTCADFLATAKIATAEPVDDAALAAQDELANGMTWLHGYLYAKNDGKIEAFSQSWVAANAKRVFDACKAASNPAETNLFDVAVS